jgi:hypothetical protein
MFPLGITHHDPVARPSSQAIAHLPIWVRSCSTCEVLTLSVREAFDLDYHILQLAPHILLLILDLSHVVVDFLQLGDHLIMLVLEVVAIGLILQSFLEFQHLAFDLIQMLFVRIVHISLSFSHPPSWGYELYLQSPEDYTTYKL